MNMRIDIFSSRLLTINIVRRIIFLIVFLYSLVFPSQKNNSYPLRVYHNNSYPPIEFLTQDRQSTGFAVELFEAVAEVMNLDYTLEGISWDSIQAKKEAQYFDVFTGIYYSHKEKDFLEYTIPILTVSYALFVRKGSPIRDLHDSIVKNVIILGGGLSSKLVNEV